MCNSTVQISSAMRYVCTYVRMYLATYVYVIVKQSDLCKCITKYVCMYIVRVIK